jgi:hypothetical protein
MGSKKRKELIHILDTDGVPLCMKNPRTPYDRVFPNFGYDNASDITCKKCRFETGKPYYHEWCGEELTWREIEAREEELKKQPKPDLANFA